MRIVNYKNVMQKTLSAIVVILAFTSSQADNGVLFSNQQQKPPKIEILDYAKAGNLPPFFPVKLVKKYKANPILLPELESLNSSEAHGAFNPAVIRGKDGIFYMFYRSQDVNSISRVSLATSKDGINFVKCGPVIVPEYDYESHGCEDPRIMQVGDTYYLTYTGYDGSNTPTCLATSTDLKDLHSWKKYGPILPAKSMAILSQKINDKYWAYFGDTNIWAAYSSDLIHWTKVNEPVLKPRPGEWDDALVESGPPPILTPYGILLIHNGNLSEDRARQKGKQFHRDQQVREYATGWALFDSEDPTHLIARDTEPFLTVTDPFDVYGQVGDVVFTEGMAMVDGKVYLYYGGGDTVVNLAIGEPVW